MNVHQQENQAPRHKKEVHSERGAQDLLSIYSLKIKSEIMIHAGLYIYTLRLNA
jgi:hypothetical protein